MSDDKHTAWNWGPAVRRRLARIEEALHASIAPDARFESGAGRSVDRGEASERRLGGNVLGYGGAAGGEDEAWSPLSDARQGRPKPSRRGLEILQAIVAELSRLESGEGVSPHGEPGDTDTPGFDFPEGFLLDADAAADDQGEHGGEAPAEAQSQGEGDAANHPPLDFEEMLKLIEELQKQPREDSGEQSGDA